MTSIRSFPKVLIKYLSDSLISINNYIFKKRKVYSKSIEIERIDGMLWASVPKIPNRFLLSFVKNYHFADVNLFWADIQKNAQLRVSSWLKKHKK